MPSSRAMRWVRRAMPLSSSFCLSSGASLPPSVQAVTRSDHVLRDKRQAGGGGPRPVGNQMPVAVLPAVAVGAMMHPSAVEILAPLDLREDVADAGGQQELPRRGTLPVRGHDLERGPGVRCLAGGRPRAESTSVSRTSTPYGRARPGRSQELARAIPSRVR